MYCKLNFVVETNNWQPQSVPFVSDIKSEKANYLKILFLLLSS